MRRFGLLASLILCAGILSGCRGETFATKAPADPLPDRSKKLYSQFNEEIIIRELLDDEKNGFFVDVGAYHWQDMSTTYFLEKYLGWSGIAVDAQASLAAGYAEHRPRTTFFGYAVTEKSGEVLPLYLAFGASSLDPEWHKRLGGDHKLASVAVLTITLNDLLARNGVTKIDFMSIDVEGSEPRVLAGFNIEDYMPRLVCIATVANQGKIGEYFEAHGYEHVYGTPDALNWYFVPKLVPTRARLEEQGRPGK